MTLVKCILFDAVNTLIHVKGSVGAIYQEVALRHGVSLDESELNHAFKKFFPKAPPLCFPGIKKSELTNAERGWWKNLVAQVIAPAQFEPQGKFEVFFEELYQTFAEAKQWQVYEDVRPALEEIHQRQIPMKVISNFDSRLHQILTDLKLAPYFTEIICSTEAGSAKPQKEIFLQAIPPHVKRDEVVMLGDEEELDIKPAKLLGLKTCLIDRKSGRGLKAQIQTLLN